jgi:hypothetical protein
MTATARYILVLTPIGQVFPINVILSYEILGKYHAEILTPGPGDDK